jgi:hypothetical protein
LRHSAKQVHKGEKMTVISSDRALRAKFTGSSIVTLVEVYASGGQIRCPRLGLNTIPVLSLAEAVAALGTEVPVKIQEEEKIPLNGHPKLMPAAQ